MEFYTPTIEDVKKIKKVFQNNIKRCCEMSPVNTILWAKHYKTEIAFWEENIIFRSQKEDGYYSYSCNLLSAKNPRKLFDKILEQSKIDDNPFQLHCMVEEEMEMIEQWCPKQFHVIWQRDESDYIYRQEKLATLSGKKLHGKRNHIHRFEEQHTDWQYETISDENEEDCVKMAIEWCMRNCKDQKNNIEYEKIDESKLVVYAIRHRKDFDMIGGAIRVNGEIIAITLGERLTSDTFVVHFEKAYSELQGAYPMINREFVKNELSEYVYVNREEDMGLEGLRKAKLSYYPDLLLNKGIIQEWNKAM